MGVFDSLLNHTFSVAGKMRTYDGQGGWSIAYYAKDSIDGRLRPATSRERETALREEREITHVFYCLADEGLARGDMITPGVMTISGFEVTSTDILVEVDAVREPSTSGHHWEVDCIERQAAEVEIIGPWVIGTSVLGSAVIS